MTSDTLNAGGAHTPGPWVLDGHNLSSVIRCTAERGSPEAKHLCGDYETIARYEGDNWAANARLGAAAPEMFEALRAAREFIANGIDLGFIRMPDADTPDPAHKTLPMIDAALAKAVSHD